MIVVFTFKIPVCYQSGTGEIGKNHIHKIKGNLFEALANTTK